MGSRRDKDFWKLRNSERVFGVTSKVYVFNNTFKHEPPTKEEAEAEERRMNIWERYGFKSMVMDKRRRNSTRKSNQKNKQRDHKIERARLKEETRKLILEVSDET